MLAFVTDLGHGRAHRVKSDYVPETVGWVRFGAIN